jgi:hypothetical protein
MVFFLVVILGVVTVQFPARSWLKKKFLAMVVKFEYLVLCLLSYRYINIAKIVTKNGIEMF